MLSPFARPPVEQIYDMLHGHQALVVHFSGTPKGSGFDSPHIYPADLHQVIGGAGRGGLSCSTVMPHDEFEQLDRANATGCVGLIVGFTSGRSILDAHPRDCGSHVENGFRIVPNARDLGIEDLEQTVLQRPADSYNEWVVASDQVLGLFAASPFTIWAESMPAEPPDLPDYLRAASPVGDFAFTDPATIATEFPDLPLFSFRHGRLVRWDDSDWTLADHRQVYAFTPPKMNPASQR